MADLTLRVGEILYRFNATETPPDPGPLSTYHGPVYPLLQDTTAQTKWVMDQVSGCGTDADACAAGFALLCATEPAKLPGNCNIQCQPITGSVSCNQPLIQDANEIWYGRSLPPPAPAPNIFEPSDMPASDDAGDYSAVSVGIKFMSDIDGKINGVRFWKRRSDPGPHLVLLYDNRLQSVAQAMTTIESDTGWQQAIFDRPIAIESGQVYTAAVQFSEGVGYIRDLSYFVKFVYRYPLTGITGVASAGSIVPTSQYQNSNYWVDVVFSKD